MRSQLNIRKSSYFLFLGYGASILIGVFAAIFFETPIPLVFPVLLLLAFQVLVDYEKIYLLLFVCIPLSTEFFISEHLATDLPTEPLIVGLMFLYFFILLVDPKKLNLPFLKHPLSIALCIHLGWIALTVFTSSNIVFSFKFLLAKIWYIVTFFYFAGHIIKSDKKINLILWLIAVPLVIATFKVIVHHATLKFGFKSINAATGPFFRNHVNYAAILTVFLPFLFYLFKWATNKTQKTFLTLGLGILLFGIVTAYTRAAYVAVGIGIAAYWVIRLRLTTLAVIISLILGFGVVNFLIVENKFMEFAPSEKTVAHTELTGIVSSTSKLEDVSTMERYYRWIAGAQMVVEKPIFGFGPGNFYHFYKKYTLERFSTYVSNNPEKSGVHNYYLMTALEQGLIGLLIFLCLIVFVVIYGERVYHQTKEKKRKDLVMAAILSTIIIDAFLIMNDMIETDKIGSFFFFNIAIIALIDMFNKEEEASPSKAIDAD